MDWDKLRVFHAVAEAGSFTHAGDKLNLSQSAVSRQISGLEDSVSAPLFHRHARGLILTEQGELLYNAVREVFAKLAMVETQLAETKEKPSGLLRVTATVAFGSVWLAPRLGEFLDLHKDVQVEMKLDDRELDLGMREADCAIRMHPPRQGDLIQRHLLSVHVHAYASQAYIDRYGLPKTATDLDKHKLIVYGDDPNPPFPSVNWLLEAGTTGGRKRKPTLQVNNVYALLRAVESGIGIAAFPDYMADQSEKAVKILPDLEGPTYEAYFVYPEELRSSKRIAVFRDYLVQKVAESQF
jgi:DNA-binding transcriptional LysR family regulator